jgi:predicted esterase
VFPPVLLLRGAKDDWYAQAAHDADATALRARGVSIDSVVHGGGHDWTDEVSAAAARWLARQA